MLTETQRWVYGISIDGNQADEETSRIKNMKFTIRDTFNSRNISSHRTLRAALESERKFIRSVRKSNGSSSYIPTKILCNGDPMTEVMLNEAIEIGIKMMSSR